MDTHKISPPKHASLKPVHHAPPADHTGSPAKKVKVEKSQHSHGHVKKEKHKHHKHHDKHSKHEKRDKMAKPSSKPAVVNSTGHVKKEPVTPIKRKPIISESESEDDLPLALLRTQMQEEQNPLVAKAAVKQEGGVSASEDDVPLAHLAKKLATPPKLSARDSLKQEAHPVTPEPSKQKTPHSSASKPLPTVTKSSEKPSKKQPEATSPTKKPGVKRKKSQDYESDNDEEFKPKKPKGTPVAPSRGKSAAAAAIGSKRGKAAVKKETATPPTKGGRKKKEETKEEVWKWWEETPHPAGVKWLTLEHKGPYFAPPYEPLPEHVRFFYAGQPMALSLGAEEAGGFFAKMLDHDYTKKEVFCRNFFTDWRKEMTREEAMAITDFEKCDFSEIHQFYKERSEERKAMSKEEKAKLKAENEKILEEYGWAIIDGHRQRIGNFKTEPPSLFRGRGDHPKQGRIKKRIEAEDVMINIGKGATVPEPPAGHKWKTVQHDNKVTWLASWSENIQGQIKYVMLNPTSRLKGEKDWAKYETARKLKDIVEKIREQYRADWKSKEMKVRQRAVAVYFIDILALRAGNEKDADESADTVGCCSLRVEHLTLHEEMDGKEHVVEFDFLGKDSIRYYNRMSVEKQVFKNIGLFMKDKVPGDDLFDRLTTATLNKHLSELMEGLTAKVFRTFNASRTLQDQLDELTEEDDTTPAKLLSYNRANRAVAILCNHQRAPPKTFDQQMSNLQEKIQAKEDAIAECRDEIKALRREVKTSKDAKSTKKLDSKKKQLLKLEEQLHKLELQATDKQENKEIALGTSKLNYLDPRISVAWCKKWGVGVEKVYNKSQREKFAWAIDMADEDFVF